MNDPICSPDRISRHKHEICIAFCEGQVSEFVAVSEETNGWLHERQ